MSRLIPHEPMPRPPKLDAEALFTMARELLQAPWGGLSPAVDAMMNQACTRYLRACGII